MDDVQNVYRATRRIPAVAVEVDGRFMSAPMAVENGTVYVLLTFNQFREIRGAANNNADAELLSDLPAIDYRSYRPRIGLNTSLGAAFLDAKATLTVLSMLAKQGALDTIHSERRRVIGLLQAALGLRVTGEPPFDSGPDSLPELPGTAVDEEIVSQASSPRTRGTAPGEAISQKPVSAKNRGASQARASRSTSTRSSRSQEKPPSGSGSRPKCP